MVADAGHHRCIDTWAISRIGRRRCCTIYLYFILAERKVLSDTYPQAGLRGGGYCLTHRKQNWPLPLALECIIICFVPFIGILYTLVVRFLSKMQPHPILDNLKRYATEAQQEKPVPTKQADLFLKILLSSTVILFIAVLILLYQVQSNRSGLNGSALNAQSPLPSSTEFQKIQLQVSLLEKIVLQKKAQSENQQKEYEQQFDRYIDHIADLQTQLDQLNTLQKQINEQLVAEQRLSEELSQQLEHETSLRRQQEAALALSKAEIQALDGDLFKEKQRRKELQVAFYNDQFTMKNIKQELEQKKSELVKKKRMLAESKQTPYTLSQN